jgi:hypothetical protein
MTRRRLNHIVSVRLTPDQMDHIRAAIGDDGNVSEYLREALLDRLYPPVPVRAFTCQHFDTAGAFNEPPTCGQCGELDCIDNPRIAS